MEAPAPRVVRGRPPKDASAPRGPDEVIDAVLQTAIQLFAERGIAAVSVREVATHAAVNPGLVHRYMGAKEDLVRAVMIRAGTNVMRDLESSQDPAYADSSDADITAYQRILAHLILEGHDLDSMPLDFPIMRYVLDRIDSTTAEDERDARLRAVCVIALDIGWRLFEPLVAAATDLEPDERAEVRAAIDRTRRRIGRTT
jgi:TetR/AcrR family transcriptional regulator, repressor for neighboring sulfatase